MSEVFHLLPFTGARAGLAVPAPRSPRRQLASARRGNDLHRLRYSCLGAVPGFYLGDTVFLAGFYVRRTLKVRVVAALSAGAHGEPVITVIGSDGRRQ